MSRYTRLQAKRQKVLNILHAAKRPTKRLWKQYHYYDRQLFKMDHKQWLKTYLKEQRTWYPYDACDWIPATLFRMIERCYIYWQHGYNIWVAPEAVQQIYQSISYAYTMVQELKQLKDHIDLGNYDLYPQYQQHLVQLFSFVGQHCDSWSD